MQKQFDIWNILKKQVNNKSKEFQFNKREI